MKAISAHAIPQTQGPHAVHTHSPRDTAPCCMQTDPCHRDEQSHRDAKTGICNAYNQIHKVPQGHICCKAGTQTLRSHRGRRETSTSKLCSDILSHICPSATRSPHPHALPHAHTSALEHLHAHTPPHIRVSVRGTTSARSPCLGTWIPELHSRSYTYSRLLPSLPPRACPREQKPSVPSSPSSVALPSPIPPPTGVHPLCPPAAEPERESRQSGRDIAPRLPGVQAAGQTAVVSAGAAAAECPGEVMAR